MLTNKFKIHRAYKGKYGLWRIINIFVFGALIFATGLTFYFIYQNVFGALANAHAIVILKSNTAVFDLDFPGYEKARLAILQKKQSDPFPPNMRNIFSYQIIPPVSTSTYDNTNTPR